MSKVIVRVPLRADLAGGTLDLWPLYLFHPASRTVNVAISYHAECEITPTNDSRIQLHLTDAGEDLVYDSIADLRTDPRAALISRAVDHFNITGIRIVTRTDAPRGSGLGGSSALAVALVRALSEIVEAPVEGDELIALVRDLETRLLGLPAGIQDYYPPVYGGLSALHLTPGKVSRHPIGYSIADLSRHMIIHYSDVSHFSGTNNWEIYRRQIEGDKEVHDGLETIAQLSLQMERALEARDIAEAGRVLLKEWEARKKLIKGISTPEIDKAIDAAMKNGAWGAKVCGAGGGGCIVMLGPPDRREAILAALRKVPGRTLDIAPVTYGLTIERAEIEQAAFSFARRSRSAIAGEPLEQLYLKTPDDSAYRPYVLAEASVTYDDPRIGVHQTLVRTLVAPIDRESLRVDWSLATLVEGDKLSLAAVPDTSKKSSGRPTGDIEAAAAEGEESFRLYLREHERMQLWHNPQLGLYSEIGESREAFLKRCIDEAGKGMGDQSERLESTFRRRFDQMREQSERQMREVEANTDEESPERRAVEVGFSWSQALYKITSGSSGDDGRAAVGQRSRLFREDRPAAASLGARGPGDEGRAGTKGALDRRSDADPAAAQHRDDQVRGVVGE
jgi:D-glycero-alpha-D-manno-heptose-7-phosphate kinase